jgi:hypothetical protein
MRPKAAWFKRTVLAVLVLSMSTVPLLSPRAQNASSASAYLFNLTPDKISDVAINGISTGVSIPAMRSSGPWQPGAPASMDVAVFFGASLTVTFADGQTWTETIDAAPSGGAPARDVGIWLFRDGCAVSTANGRVQQFTWAGLSLMAMRRQRPCNDGLAMVCAPGSGGLK